MNGYEIAIKQIEDKIDILPYVQDMRSALPYDTYIVHIKYKYDYEDNYTDSYEVFEYGIDNVIWFNDWCEGQTDVVVLGIYSFAEIPPTIFHYLVEH